MRRRPGGRQGDLCSPPSSPPLTPLARPRRGLRVALLSLAQVLSAGSMPVLATPPGAAGQSAVAASPPAPEAAIVLHPGPYWRSYRWPGKGWTRAAAVDDREGVTRFTLAEALSRHVWRYRLELPVQVDRYPQLVLSYRASPGLPRPDDFLLWLDDGRGPAYSDWFPLRGEGLVADGGSHTLRADLRATGAGRTVVALALAVRSGARVPARLEVLGLRFEAADALAPPPPAPPIAVRVEDGDGEPLAGVTVTVDAERRNWARAAVTDRDGRTALTPLATASGRHMLRLRRPGWVETVRGGLGEDAGPVRLRLEPGTMYGGQVVDAQDIPLAGVAVEVRLRRTRGSDRPLARPVPVLFTDTDGRWRTPVLPARGIDFKLRFTHLVSGATVVDRQVDAQALRKGRSRTVISGTGITVHRAAQLGLTDWLQAALARDPSLLEQRDGERTPLHTAARHDRVEVVALLLEHGAAIDDDGPGKTPLHEAVEYGAVHVVQLLLERGADPNARAASDSTPLHHGIWALTENRCTVDELRRSIELLVAHGADLQAVHRSVGTPLEYAVQVSPGQIVDLLRALGAANRTYREE